MRKKKLLAQGKYIIDEALTNTNFWHTYRIISCVFTVVNNQMALLSMN